MACNAAGLSAKPRIYAFNAYSLRDCLSRPTGRSYFCILLDVVRRVRTPETYHACKLHASSYQHITGCNRIMQLPCSPPTYRQYSSPSSSTRCSSSVSQHCLSCPIAHKSVQGRCRVKTRASIRQAGPATAAPDYKDIEAQPLNKVVMALFRRKMVTAIGSDSELQG